MNLNLARFAIFFDSGVVSGLTSSPFRNRKARRMTLKKSFIAVVSALTVSVSISGCSFSQSSYSVFKSDAKEIQATPWYINEGSPCHKMIKSIERVILNMAWVADGTLANTTGVILSLEANPELYNPLLTYSIDEDFSSSIERINDLEGAMRLEISADNDFSDLAETYLAEYQSLKLRCSS